MLSSSFFQIRKKLGQIEDLSHPELMIDPLPCRDKHALKGAKSEGRKPPASLLYTRPEMSMKVLLSNCLGKKGKLQQ